MHLGLVWFTPDKAEIGVPRHPWFLLSDPAKSDRLVIVNVSTKKCPSGEVCRVARGEHEKISQDSYLRFREVRVIARATLEDLITNEIVQRTTDANEDLVRKLQAAVLASRAVVLEAQKILKDQA